MVRAWQRWLSPRPINLTNTSTKNTFYSVAGAARFDIIPGKNNSWSLRETHYIENPRVKAGLSGPPLHLHFRQDEHFKVEQGILAAEVDGKQYALTKDDGVLTIRAGSRHRFWSPTSSTESLVFHGWADPCKDVDHILDINFLRNIVSYVADCDKAGLSPSIFQIILFYHDASSLWTPSALNWMPASIINVIHYVAAYWIAMRLLGYKTSYEEYTGKDRME
ncbi:hypothetical protein SLS62_011371 [Diatrype stigma]|uniref:Uncharacterized protein n=1 Tax=Diatrype stigma TaxID=117547 RepID=A0AAN9UCC0_9PEZI